MDFCKLCFEIAVLLWIKPPVGTKVSRSLLSISVLRSEVQDLRLVLQSSDKELATVKDELRDQSEQQREMSELSNSLISTQLQLDKVQ